MNRKRIKLTDKVVEEMRIEEMNRIKDFLNGKLELTQRRDNLNTLGRIFSGVERYARIAAGVGDGCCIVTRPRENLPTELQEYGDKLRDLYGSLKLVHLNPPSQKPDYLIEPPKK